MALTDRRFLILSSSLAAVAAYFTFAGPREAESAALPSWVSGAFETAESKYADRQLVIDHETLHFQRGATSLSVLHVEHVALVKGPETVLTFDVRVRDGADTTTMRLTAAPGDSSVRLQTMPNVVWRRSGAARFAAPAMTVTMAAAPAAPTVQSDESTPRRDTLVAHDHAHPDTVASEAAASGSFVERNVAALELLSGVLGPCRRNGCRIGVLGLLPRDYAAFTTFLTEHGAKAITLTPMSSPGTPLAMLEIAAEHTVPARGKVSDSRPEGASRRR